MVSNLLAKKQNFYSHQLSQILIVEDDYINRMLLSDYLKYSGYNVTSLSNGANFFLTINIFQPDLILLDLKLPDIDGYYLLQQMQQQPDFSKIPVIVVSALAFKVDQQRAMDLGARDYLVKPINLNLLTLKIEHALAYSHI
ncbi:response regulator [Anabaena sp. CCY 9402-a]|uniref:response regulator n=1 Tax=Anabaena sp. CCY 9402-a TaxID=3103867 RepID=UPI0039C6ED08